MGRPKGTDGRVRERLLEAAGRGFRVGGYGGIGVDGLAKEAGLTSGAFYAHFDSKADAFRGAIVEGLRGFTAAVVQFRERFGAGWREAFVDFYLVDRMAVELCEACVLPTLTADATRADEATREAYEAELRGLVDVVAEGLGTDDGRERAWALLAVLSGTAAMGRAVRDVKLREEILAAGRKRAKEI